MAEQATKGGGGGGGGGVLNVLGFVGDIVTGISNIIVAGQYRKAAMTPAWMQPSQFQRRDRTYEFVIGGIILVIVVILIAVTIISTKK